MNKKMKMSLTAMMTGVLVLSSVAAFAGTTSVKGALTGHQSMIDLMLKDGVVTQAQIDKYQKQMQDERKEEVKAAVQTLVTKGTLTQAKADAVIKAVVSHQEEMTALHEKLEGMTQEEAKAYLTANPVQRNDDMLKLVENGTLTAAEFDAVRSVIGGGRGGMMGGFGGRGDGHMGGRGRGPMGGFAPATTTGTAQ